MDRPAPISHSEPLGEVVEASTATFIAEGYELHRPPPLGELVRTTADAVVVYAVVGMASTAGIDPLRRPVARGRGSAGAADVYRQHPQLAELLRTQFEGLVVAHGREGALACALPPLPATLHEHVFPCSPEEIRRLGEAPGFVEALAAVAEPGQIRGEELVPACLRRMSAVQADGGAFLLRSARRLAVLMRGDPVALGLVLGRLRR